MHFIQNISTSFPFKNVIKKFCQVYVYLFIYIYLFNALNISFIILRFKEKHQVKAVN